MTQLNGVGEHGETGVSRSARLDRILAELVSQVPEIEAASVVSFDGLPMAAALPLGMDEDRVAAMSAALLSLGERAAEGLGRGELSQVYVEGENGTVFLVSADDEAVLVAVAARGAKVGLMLFEARRAAVAVGQALKVEPFFGEEPEPRVEPFFTSDADDEPLVADVVAPWDTDELVEQQVAPMHEPMHEAPMHEAPAPVRPLRALPESDWTADQRGSLAPNGSHTASDVPGWS